MRTFARGFAPLCIVGAVLTGTPDRAGAQDLDVTVGARGAYDGYYELDDHLPARRPVAPKVTVVTERRVVTTEPVFGPARRPPALVSTRRVVKTEPVGVLDDDDEIATGSLGEVAPPRVVRTRTFVARPAAPVTKEVVTTRRFAAPPPVEYYGERRQVVTTRRIVTTEPGTAYDAPEAIVTRRQVVAPPLEDFGAATVVTTRRVVRQPEW